MVEVSVHVIDRLSGRGGWIDLHDYTDYNEFKAVADKVCNLAYEPAIDDAEAPFPIDTVTSLRDVWGIFELLDMADEPGAMAAYLAYHGWDLNVAPYFEDAYCGTRSDLEEYAEEYFESTRGKFNVPGFNLIVNTEWWDCNYYTMDNVEDGGVYIFRSV